MSRWISSVDLVSNDRSSLDLCACGSPSSCPYKSATLYGIYGRFRTTTSASRTGEGAIVETGMEMGGDKRAAVEAEAEKEDSDGVCG